MEMPTVTQHSSFATTTNMDTYPLPDSEGWPNKGSSPTAFGIWTLQPVQHASMERPNKDLGEVLVGKNSPKPTRLPAQDK